MFSIGRFLRLIHIPKERVELLRSRASGPGGQNIAASNSKVQLRFELESADWIPEHVRNELAKYYGRTLVIVSQESRSCRENENLCFMKLRKTLEKTENKLKRPPRKFDNLAKWIESVRTEKQIQRHKEKREEYKRKDAERRKAKMLRDNDYYCFVPEFYCYNNCCTTTLSTTTL